MNFYNPYYIPYQTAGKTSLLGLFKKINFTSIINGAQKTLNTVNQIIPLVKQAKPMMDNAKTMFKLMSEFNRDDSVSAKKDSQEKTVSKKTVSNIDALHFFNKFIKYFYTINKLILF